MAVESTLRDGLARLAEQVMTDIADEFVTEAKSTAQRRSGDLVESIDHGGVRGAGARYSTQVTVGAEHGIYQEAGTGVYAGRGRITPGEEFDAVSFYWHAVGAFVAFASVAGTPPTRWWSRAVKNWPQVVQRAAS